VKKAVALISLIAMRLGLAAAQVAPQGGSMPGEAEVRQMLVDRIDVRHQSVGIVVGVIGPDGRRIVAYRQLEKGDRSPLNGDTIFEIGSATKVFTSLLLADMVRRGEVVLSDPVSKYLPEGVKMPERNGRSITLVDLATHASGLPRLPTNMAPKAPANPYADYSVEQLYQFLSSYQLTRDIGSQYEYSNLGGGLLGHVLARRAGMSYEELVRTRICEPLAMNSTEITLTPEQKKRLATGHDAAMRAVSNWDLPTLAGAGALRSTANDLLTFLSANLGYTKTPLAPAMADMLKVRRPTGQAGLEMRWAGTFSPAAGRMLYGTTVGPADTGRSWALIPRPAMESWLYRMRRPSWAWTTLAGTCSTRACPWRNRRRHTRKWRSTRKCSIAMWAATN